MEARSFGPTGRRRCHGCGPAIWGGGGGGGRRALSGNWLAAASGTDAQDDADATDALVGRKEGDHVRIALANSEDRVTIGASEQSGLHLCAPVHRRQVRRIRSEHRAAISAGRSRDLIGRDPVRLGQGEVEVIDDDLGKSGTAADGRAVFSEG